MVISLSAKGLSTGEVQAHLVEAYGAAVSRQTISTITDRVMGGMAEWTRPLDDIPMSPARDRVVRRVMTAGSQSPCQ